MRQHIQTDDPTLFIAVGKDHACGYFVQVYDNGEHSTECECLQCEYDLPLVDKDQLPGWTGVIAAVREATGLDITGQIVGV